MFLKVKYFFFRFLWFSPTARINSHYLSRDIIIYFDSCVDDYVINQSISFFLDGNLVCSLFDDEAENFTINF